MTDADRLATVIAEIAAERRRQIEVEGWTPEHDDGHSDQSLAIAASCYAMPPGARTIKGISVETALWPWNWITFKRKGRRRDLIRAAALIVAEIERLDRAA